MVFYLFQRYAYRKAEKSTAKPVGLVKLLADRTEHGLLQQRKILKNLQQ